MGRPAKYTKKLCKELPEMFANGESVAEVCQQIGIARRTFYNWLEDETKPEFKEAYEDGQALSEAFWMRLGRLGAAGKVDINAATWIFNMKNRFGWKDKQEHTGANDGPIAHHTTVTYEGVESDGRRGS
jgi:predicted RNase H-like HicB family nuclease